MNLCKIRNVTVCVIGSYVSYDHLASNLLVLHHGEHPASKESSAVLACTYWYRSQTTLQKLPSTLILILQRKS